MASEAEEYVRLPAEVLREHAFNWRVLVARLVVYGLALALASLILPGFVIKPVEGHEIFSLMILAAVYGVVVALIKPVFQFLALPFIIETSGLVIIVINIIIFLLFDAFAGPLTELGNFGWIILAGILVWLLSFLFENLLGIPRPILTDIPPDRDEELPHPG